MLKIISFFSFLILLNSCKNFEKQGGGEFKLSEKPTINELFSSCGTKFEESFISKGYKLSKVYYPEKPENQLFYGDYYNGRERVLKNSHYSQYYYFELHKEINGIYSIVSPSGLNYRKSIGLKSQILGKFSYEEKVRILEETNEIVELDDYDSLGNFTKKIKGNWVKVISVSPNKEGYYNSGYVVDGYLKKSKDYTSETKTYSSLVDLTDCSVSNIKEYGIGEEVNFDTNSNKIKSLDCFDVSLEYLDKMNLETILWLHNEGYVGGNCSGKPNEYCGRVQEFINGKYWTYDIILITEKNELGECKVVGIKKFK